MNRLILIGNGFDLAHGLKTDYNSFILWYLKKCLSSALDKNLNKESYKDRLITVDCPDPTWKYYSHNTIEIVPDLVDYYYANGLIHLFKDDRLYVNAGSSFRNPFKVFINSSFFDVLVLKCNNTNWVDIENEFYNKLKELLDIELSRRSSLLEKLNNDLQFIMNELEEYLSTIKCEKHNSDYVNIFNSSFDLSDILKSSLKTHDGPVDSLILNFNYTAIVEEYLKRSDHLPRVSSNIKVNYIHGMLNNNDNKIIFGFGDELDEDYKKMELSKDNGFFEHIKSFGYFKTSNYQELIRFIDSDEYQIFALGHSCGLSDRTLLNMIFEHENCKSIKIFYHGTKEKNNYIRLTQEISRHFRDKVAMRAKIVPFDKSFPMPQIG